MSNMTFTATEVTAALLEAHNIQGRKYHEKYVQEFPDSPFGSSGDYEDITEPDWGEVYGTTETSIGDVKVVETVGGEGQGEHAHLVLQTVATGQFFKIEGYYSSYGGTDWDGSELHEVHPVAKTIVVYE